MGNLVFQAALGGQVAVSGPNTASSYTINVPTVSGTFVTTGDTATVTSTMISGPLSVAVGGTGVTTSTGSGSNVLNTSPTLVTPVLGTPTSVTLTNATGLPLTTGVTGTLPVANGGTGLTSYTANGVVYASSTSALATGSALTFDGTLLTQTVSDAATSNKWAAATGKLRLRPYVDATNGAIFESTNAAESAYLPFSLFGSNLYLGADTAVVGKIGGTEQMRLTSTGLGIGTSSPSQKLTVAGNIVTTGAGFVRSVGTGSGSAGVGPNIGVTDNAYYYIQQLNASSGYDTWFFNGAWNLRSTLDSSGNLGLGVTPSAWNNIFKAIQVNAQGALMATPASMQMGNNIYYDGAYKFIGTGYANRYVQAGGQHYWTVSTASGSAGGSVTETQAMTLDASENLLVGTTGLPIANGKLSVSGLSRFYQSAADTTAAVAIDKSSATNTTSQVFTFFSVNNQSTPSGQINANGASQAAFGSFSDKRLKENIVDLPPQLANIMTLRPVEFDYIESEGGGHQISFIAQEFEQVYPDAVGERVDGMKTLTGWSKTEARLVKAIQEQQALIQSLTARVAQLEKGN